MQDRNGNHFTIGTELTPKDYPRKPIIKCISITSDVATMQLIDGMVKDNKFKINQSSLDKSGWVVYTKQQNNPEE